MHPAVPRSRSFRDLRAAAPSRSWSFGALRGAALATSALAIVFALAPLGCDGTVLLPATGDDDAPAPAEVDRAAGSVTVLRDAEEAARQRALAHPPLLPAPLRLGVAPTLAVGAGQARGGDAVAVSAHVPPGVARVRLFLETATATRELGELAAPSGAVQGTVTLPVDASAGPARLCAVAAGAPAALGDVACAPLAVAAALPGGVSGVARALGPNQQVPAPIAGATVVVRDRAGLVAGTTTTAVDGSYHLGNLRPGDYAVSVFTPGAYVDPVHVVVGAASLVDPGLTGTFSPVLAHIDHVGAIAIVTDPASGAVTDVGAVGQSVSKAGVLARLARLPSGGQRVPVRFFAEATFFAGTERKVRFDLVDGSGKVLWSITKFGVDTVYADVPRFHFDAYTSSLLGFDRESTDLPAGDLRLDVTATVDGTVAARKHVIVHVDDLEARWFAPWLRDQVVTDDAISGEGLAYHLRARLPRTPDFDFSKPIDLGLHTFDNHVRAGVDLHEDWVSGDGPGALSASASIGASATLMDSNLLDKSFDYTAGYDASPMDVAPVSLAGFDTGPITIFQYGPGIACFNACILGCEVCAGYKLWVDFELKGSLDFSSRIHEDLSLGAQLEPSLEGIVGGHFDGEAVICSAHANVVGSAKIGLPFRYESQSSSGPGSIGFASPCLTLGAHLDGDIGCLGVSIGAGGSYGPYQYGDCGSGLAPPPGNGPDAGAARVATSVAARPSVAALGDGRAVAVWLVNETKQSGGLAPRLVASIGDGQSWSAPHPITPAPSLVADPAVASLGHGRALAVWTENKLPLAQLLAGGESHAAHWQQEIRYARFDGQAWSAPASLTSDDLADGVPAVAGDPATGRALVVWVRQAGASGALAHLALTAAPFDGASFGALRPVDPSGTLGVDARPSVAADGKGGFWVAWAHDADGNLADHGDRRLYAARFAGGQLGARELVAGAPAGAHSPSVAVDVAGGGAPLVAFVVPPVDQQGKVADGLGNRSRLFFAQRSPKGWHAAPIAGTTYAEGPVVRIDGAREATVVFRRFGAKGEGHDTGDLALATARLGAGGGLVTGDWSRGYLSSDGLANWQTAFDLDPKSGRALILDVKEARADEALGAVREGLRTPQMPSLVALGGEGHAALAVRALARRPELVVGAGDVELVRAGAGGEDEGERDDDHGGKLVARARVENVGLASVPAGKGVVVRFWERATDAAPPKLLGSTKVHAPIGFNSAVVATLPQPIAPVGLHRIAATAQLEGEPLAQPASASFATLGAFAAPSVRPAGLAAGQVALAWSAGPKGHGALQYEVRRAPGSPQQLGDLQLAPDTAGELLAVTRTPSFVDASALAGVAYAYRVVTRAADGASSPPSAPLRLRVPGAAPNQ